MAFPENPAREADRFVVDPSTGPGQGIALGAAVDQAKGDILLGTGEVSDSSCQSDDPGGDWSALKLARAVFDAVVVFEVEALKVRQVDVGARRLFGIEDEERVEDLTWPTFFHGENLPILLYDMLPALERGEHWRGEILLRRRDGTDLPVQAFVAACWLDHGKTRGALFGALDRTDAANLLAALRHEQVLLRALLDTVPDAVYFKDLQSHFIRVSTAKARKIGVANPEMLIGKSDFDHFTDEHAQQAYRDEQEIIRSAEGIIDYEEKETWPDGRVTWVSSTKLPLRNPTGRIIGTFGISRDITERKRADEERRQMEVQLNLAQKMESVGRLAAGIAHEVNTPTQFINDNTHFLVDATRQISGVLAAYRGLAEAAASGTGIETALRAARAAEEAAELGYLQDEIPKTLEQTLDGIARIAKIVRSLKEFSHPSAPEKRPANLNHAIETTVNVTRHEWKYVADVVTDLDPDLPSVPCMLDEFNQVILNLVVNAAHAIADVVKDSGDKGLITVRTRCDGEWALIEVEDTGTGIPEAARSRIFEPFFTTKAMGKGTGQGLAMVQTIIAKKHLGRISFTTASGKGTTFHLRLPVHPSEASAAT